jgi:hypothetical protein
MRFELFQNPMRFATGRNSNSDGVPVNSSKPDCFAVNKQTGLQVFKKRYNGTQLG